MTLKSRLDRLSKLVHKTHTPEPGRGRKVRMRSCAALEWDDLLAAVDKTLLPESLPILEGVLTLVNEYDQRRRAEGRDDFPHGFVHWLYALQDGWALLPPRIPHAVMLAWKAGSAEALQRTGGSPRPFCRCEDCLMVLPNANPQGWGPPISPCPVCGSERLAAQDLSKPWGTFHEWGKRKMMGGGLSA